MTSPVGMTAASPPAAAGPGRPPVPDGGSVGTGRQVGGTMLLIFASVLVGFAIWLAFGSRLYFARVQHDSYQSFRVPLASGVAPVGPTDPFNPNRLVALGTPVAILKIPAIQMQDVVLEGSTGRVLQGGPGHVRDTVLPGQQGVSVILGRRAAYGGPFAGLGSLVPGEPITVVTQEGVAQYQVIDIRREGDPLPPALADGSGRLVLVTADGPPFAPTGKLFIDADLVTKPFATPAPVLTAATLPPDENAMGIDNSAWVPIVLWGQLLVLAAAAASWLSRAWGRWQTWIVAIPVLGYLSVIVADQVTRLLPNIL